MGGAGGGSAPAVAAYSNIPRTAAFIAAPRSVLARRLGSSRGRKIKCVATATETCSTRGMRVRVDPDLCEGYAMCVSLLPEVFEMGEDVPVTVVADPVDPGLLKKLQEAVANCPRNALRIQE